MIASLTTVVVVLFVAAFDLERLWAGMQGLCMKFMAHC